MGRSLVRSSYLMPVKLEVDDEAGDLLRHGASGMLEVCREAIIVVYCALFTRWSFGSECIESIARVSCK